MWISWLEGLEARVEDMSVFSLIRVEGFRAFVCWGV